jgi:hypothetical protein
VKNKKSLTDDLDMEKYVCEGCGAKYFDTGLYFYGKPSVKCLWCTKFPKQKERK